MWHAVYTRSRAEKKVCSELNEIGVEAYVPLIETIRQWSDRKKKVELPLISCYVFVNIKENEYLQVLKNHGVAGFVKFGGKPGIIPDQQINNLKLLTKWNEPIEIVGEKLAVGDKVQVTAGSLEGLQGYLVQFKGSKKVAVHIDCLETNFLVDIHQLLLKKID